ncbi:MAG: hypothetical protein IT372_21165 [Polyangiaceae bacterium]|nr:hypothetical protein [Polyangiaceae bacterium]
MIPRRQIDPCWTDSRRLDAHRALARVLVPGEEGRLLHLVAAKDAREAAREAVELARCRAAGGDLAAAIAALGEGLAAARALAEGGRREELSVLTEWVTIAFEQGTPRALDRALYELSRAARGPEVERLEALVRAVGAAPGASGARALDLAEDLPAFDDPELERRRQGVRVVVAASRSSPEMLEEVLEDVAAWAERSGEPMARWTLLEGQAWLRHAQGRYEEAATLHAEAAGEQRRAAGRIASMQSAASALLEGFRHREAAEQAAAARDAAAACRSPYGEGRAEWLLRAARYRLGEAVEPDLELVEAVARVGVPELEALVCLNEAAVAFRAGAARLAVELAGRAADLWRRLDRPAGALLARCLALACGAPAEDGEMSLLVGKALQCAVPGMGAQALGLLGRAAPAMRGQWAGAVEGLLEGIPRERWGLRMDVLSAEEALAWAEPHRNE